MSIAFDMAYKDTQDGCVSPPFIQNILLVTNEIFNTLYDVIFWCWNTLVVFFAFLF